MGKYTPECPFCGKEILPPEHKKTELGEVLSGKCQCGAVYVCDPTGHNAGEAYMEALALAKGDWQIDTLDPEEDYQTADLEYDAKTHSRIYAKSQGASSGRLIFVKMKKEPTDKVRMIEEKPRSPERGKPQGKRHIESLLEASAFDEIAALAKDDKGVIRWLISLSYDKEQALSWRAIEAAGVVAKELAKSDMHVVRDTIRRLLWSMGEESGGIGWSAPEMIGEIVRNCPDELSDIVPILWSFRDEEMFRAGVVWGMGRIARARPEFARPFIPDLVTMLSDQNPFVRGYAALCLGVLREGQKALDPLTEDRAEVFVYEEGALRTTQVGALARAALKNNNGK